MAFGTAARFGRRRESLSAEVGIGRADMPHAVVPRSRGCIPAWIVVVDQQAQENNDSNSPRAGVIGRFARTTPRAIGPGAPGEADAFAGGIRRLEGSESMNILQALED